ncbi:CoA pyrophosphatase [Ruixingdingia sedimenti]|uniref:CoA pyrophosphatase n=1 Tax=Ruixingdingia sedimenti TaxID=3073604 RepID=A0ABU1F6X5_9RHOB|nr:CoA pyrophosphatase [Xinfangfangia sp. LG-4]MDR5652631.1 CoA pyrophosphatase [Xinfangfangia sp. LG-4]
MNDGAEVGRLRKALAGPMPASSDFDLNPGVQLDPGRVLRPAAVLIGLLPGPAGMELVLTKRSSRLRHHPGQIALPGGKIDAGDGSPEAAALREAEEEVGLDRRTVDLLGQLPPHETVTGYRITPVVGVIRAPFAPVPEAGEVDEVFRVPFAHVADPGRYRVERRQWLGAWRNYYAVPWGPYYIWGATARILRGLAERVQA